MIVVHALVTAAGRLALWAESAEPAPGRGCTHPFAVLPPVAGPVDTITVRLPSHRKRPLASPEAGGAAEVAGATMQPWTVRVVYPPPDVDVEAALSNMDDVRLGSSVGVLADVRSFAREIGRAHV